MHSRTPGKTTYGQNFAPRAAFSEGFRDTQQYVVWPANGYGKRVLLSNHEGFEGQKNMARLAGRVLALRAPLSS